MSFLTDLEMRQEEPEVFILTKSLVYRDSKFAIKVYEGFDFDGASIPKAFWSIIGSPMFGRHVRAACLHDALYASKLLSREDCDNLFLEAMRSDGVTWLTSKLMYMAVRIAGKKAYDNGDFVYYRTLVKVIPC